MIAAENLVSDRLESTGNFRKGKKIPGRNIILLIERNCGTTQNLPIWN
jgi:hypothetical protein